MGFVGQKLKDLDTLQLSGAGLIPKAAPCMGVGVWVGEGMGRCGYGWAKAWV